VDDSTFTSVCERGRVQQLTLRQETGSGMTLALTIQSTSLNRIHEVRFLDVRDLRFLVNPHNYGIRSSSA